MCFQILQPKTLGLKSPARDLHHSILGHTAMGICVYAFPCTTTGGEVLDKADVEGAATILVSLKLVDSSFCRISIIEADDSASPRATTWFVLNLCLLNLADCGKKLYQIIVASGPW